MGKPPSKDRRLTKSFVKVVRKSKVLAVDSNPVGQQHANDESAVSKEGFALSVGDRVTHKIFGAGVVLRVNGTKCEIKFEAVGVKWILGSFLGHSR